MKICIINAAYDHSESPFKEFDPEPDPSLYLPEHECELHHIHKATAVAQIRDLVAKGFDVFINLCDGAYDEDRAGIEVIHALEKFGAAYTGADAGFYEPSREAMKMACASAGVRAPGYVLCHRTEEAALALRNLQFPMIVKHPSSYGSIGLTKKSRVDNEQDLMTQVQSMIEQFGSALIEEFIEGREYTVLIAEDVDHPEKPFTLAPVEYVFPPGETFKHFDLKWIEFEGMDIAFCEDPALAAEMQEMTRRLFLALNGRGYGRTDIRVDAQGRPWVLEINPNPSIFYPEPEFGSADNVLKFDAEGHAGFLRRIIKSALHHQKRRHRKYKVMQDRHQSFGLYAKERIAAGEVIIPYEGKAQNLVTRTYARQHWNYLEKDWFDSYATPITEEVWAVWSENPEEWKPINHSCDPSAWLTGLDVTARRDLAPGEAITLDYATFCNEQMKPFDCQCGSATCRGRITGNDYKLPVLDAYGDHLSDYIKTLRKRG